MSDTTKLLAEAREHRQNVHGGGWCEECTEKWPCLSFRLADALEAEHADRDVLADELAGAQREWGETLTLAKKLLDERSEARAALPKEVTTVEELDVLPARTLLLLHNGVVCRKRDSVYWIGLETGYIARGDELRLPARILFAPSVTPGGEDRGDERG